MPPAQDPGFHGLLSARALNEGRGQVAVKRRGIRKAGAQEFLHCVLARHAEMDDTWHSVGAHPHSWNRLVLLISKAIKVGEILRAEEVHLTSVANLELHRLVRVPARARVLEPGHYVCVDALVRCNEHEVRNWYIDAQILWSAAAAHPPCDGWHLTVFEQILEVAEGHHVCVQVQHALETVSHAIQRDSLPCLVPDIEAGVEVQLYGGVRLHLQIPTHLLGLGRHRANDTLLRRTSSDQVNVGSAVPELVQGRGEDDCVCQVVHAMHE
mmetsp:Transcript_96299/g.272238  ORF Transcript_96299/g.272238 Transcript_96299/m.272238 type:complete len:268 (-) Transcript_96299:161-964(-)